MVCVCISILLQILVGCVLVFLAKEGEFIDEGRRLRIIRSNNYLTLMCLLTSIINIFISVFIAV